MAARPPMTYAASGVDIEAGDQLVDLIKSMVRQTHGPRVLGAHGAFAGMFRLDYNERLFRRNYRDPVLVACTDGVGTKVKIAIETGRIDTIGIDCVAMNVNDLIVQGGEPLLFLDYIGMHKQEPRRTAEIVQGVADGCRIAGCALIGGECAEMPDIYAENEFDLVGFSLGVVELHRAIDPMRVEADDVVIGLESDGVHSNGYSLVRRIIATAGLDLNRHYAESTQVAGQTLSDLLLTPTRIYARPIVRLLQRYKVKRIVSGMAHITGGGLADNICRALPDDVDVVIHRDAWTPPPLFDFLRQQGGIDPDEMDRVFNLGIGYVLIVRPAFADSVARQLAQMGERVHVIGAVKKGTGQVALA